MPASDGKILVVDDNEDILLAARMLLSQHVAAVHTEKDPNNIPNLLRNNSYDAVLLDMNFTQDVASGQEGFHWLGRILDIDPGAVVVLITAYGDAETKRKALESGAEGLLTKPIDFALLREEIDSRLAQAAS